MSLLGAFSIIPPTIQTYLRLDANIQHHFLYRKFQVSKTKLIYECPEKSRICQILPLTPSTPYLFNTSDSSKNYDGADCRSGFQRTDCLATLFHFIIMISFVLHAMGQYYHLVRVTANVALFPSTIKFSRDFFPGSLLSQPQLTTFL